MRVFLVACVAFLVGGVSTATIPKNIVRDHGCDAPVVLNSSTNVWKDYELHANRIYLDVVTQAAEEITDLAEQVKALRVANTGNFAWM